MDSRDHALKPLGAIALAALLAIAVQPIVFFLWVTLPPWFAGEDMPLADVARFSLLAAVVATPFVLLIGVPSALLLRRFGRLRWLPLAAIGFIAAALPAALTLPGGDAGYSSGGNFHGRAVEFVIDGVPTIYGWLSYLQSLLFFGLHGLVGASVFHAVWIRSMGPGDSSRADAASRPGSAQATGTTDAWLVYDGECPVCRAYCLRVRINDAVGRLHLIDAREPGPLMDEITALGLDIDQGMVLKFEDVIYYGPEAVRMLTLLGTRVGWFNRLAVAFFGGTRRSNFWYPIGKAARNVVLKVLGIRYIDNLGTARAATS